MYPYRNHVYLMGRSEVFLRKACLSKNSGCHSCRVRVFLLGQKSQLSLSCLLCCLCPVFIHPNLHMNVWVLGLLDFLTVPRPMRALGRALRNAGLPHAQ